MKTEVKNPTRKQIEFVIGKLKDVEEQASEEGAFDMAEVRVKSNYCKCGTVHCVAGWYAVANIRRKDIVDTFKDKNYVGFLSGADLMAKDLGMEDCLCLKGWAKENSKIWGNYYGDTMFNKESAYNHKGFSGVIKHWEEVLERIIKLENKK